MALDVGELLAALEASGIRLHVVDGQVRVVAPRNALTDADKAAIRQHRAEIIDFLQGRENQDQAIPLVRVDRDRRLPLSYGQQRLWFLAQLEPDSIEYNVPMPVRIEGALDVDALTAALEALLERHEVLRTRLVADQDGVPYQVISPAAEFDLDHVDLTAAADPFAAAADLLAQLTAVPFDLAAGPLIRGTLIRLAPDDHVLGLSMHHVVFDEWSVVILERELAALYTAFRRGEPSPLTPLALQYADFAVWQRAWLTGEVLEEQLGYWRDNLAGAVTLELPTDRPRPPLRSSAGAVFRFTVEPELTGRLREAARGRGATMFMTLFAAFTVL